MATTGRGTRAVGALLLGASTCCLGPAFAQVEPQVLDDMQSIQIMQETVGKDLPADAGIITPMGFDWTSREWRIRVDRAVPNGSGEVIVTVNEATGGVCAQRHGGGGCFATGDASAFIDAQRAKRRVQR